MAREARDGSGDQVGMLLGYGRGSRGGEWGPGEESLFMNFPAIVFFFFRKADRLKSRTKNAAKDDASTKVTEENQNENINFVREVS